MHPIVKRILFNLCFAGGLALVFFSTQRGFGGTPTLVAGIVLLVLGAGGLLFGQMAGTRRDPE